MGRLILNSGRAAARPYIRLDRIFRTYNSQLGTCNCYFLRTENRSTINQFLLLLRTRHLLPPTTVSQKPRSRNKFGMTTLDYRDNLAFHNAELVSASSSWFLTLTKNEEMIFSLKNRFFYSENGQPFSGQPFLLLLRTRYLQPPTTSLEVQIPKQVRDDSSSCHSGMLLAIIWFVQLLKRTISILGKIDP